MSCVSNSIVRVIFSKVGCEERPGSAYRTHSDPNQTSDVREASARADKRSPSLARALFVIRFGIDDPALYGYDRVSVVWAFICWKCGFSVISHGDGCGLSLSINIFIYLYTSCSLCHRA